MNFIEFKKEIQSQERGRQVKPLDLKTRGPEFSAQVGSDNTLNAMSHTYLLSLSLPLCLSPTNKLWINNYFKDAYIIIINLIF